MFGIVFCGLVGFLCCCFWWFLVRVGLVWYWCWLVWYLVFLGCGCCWYFELGYWWLYVSSDECVVWGLGCWWFVVVFGWWWYWGSCVVGLWLGNGLVVVVFCFCVVSVLGFLCLYSGCWLVLWWVDRWFWIFCVWWCVWIVFWWLCFFWL